MRYIEIDFMKKMQKYFPIVIIVVVFALIILVAYYFLHILPSYNLEKLHIEREKIELEKQKQESEMQQQALLDRCIKREKMTYQERWDDECKRIGYQANCNLTLLYDLAWGEMYSGGYSSGGPSAEFILGNENVNFEKKTSISNPEDITFQVTTKDECFELYGN